MIKKVWESLKILKTHLKSCGKQIEGKYAIGFGIKSVTSIFLNILFLDDTYGQGEREPTIKDCFEK